MIIIKKGSSTTFVKIRLITDNEVQKIGYQKSGISIIYRFPTPDS